MPEDDAEDRAAHVLGLHRPGWRTVLRLLVGVVLAVLLSQALVSSAGGVGNAIAALRGATVALIIPAALFETLSYGLFGAIFARLSRPRVTWIRSTMTGVVAFGLGNVLPGTPAPGLVLAGRALRRCGLSSRKVGIVLGFVGWFLARTFLILVVIAVVFGVVTRKIPDEQTLPAVLGVVVAVLALGLTMLAAMRPGTATRAAVLFGRIRFHRPSLDPADSRESAAQWHAEAMERVGSPRRRVQMMATSLASWVADATALWFALTAVGVRVDLPTLLITYVAGISAAMLPLLPGGIGVVEVAMPTILGWYGAPVDQSLAGVLIWRAISLYLPALIGLAFLALMQRWPDESEASDPFDEQIDAEDNH